MTKEELIEAACEIIGGNVKEPIRRSGPKTDDRGATSERLEPQRAQVVW